MTDNPHIGKVIKSLVEKSDFNSSVIASKLGISYQNLYKIYNKESVETHYLFEISEILNVHISAFFNLPQKGWVSESEINKLNKEISRLQDKIKDVEEQLEEKKLFLKFILKDENLVPSSFIKNKGRGFKGDLIDFSDIDSMINELDNNFDDSDTIKKIEHLINWYNERKKIKKD